MKVAPVPANEALRIAALKKYSILDSEAEATFDKITGLASAVCETKIAIISLVDTDRLWFKSCHGTEAKSIKREASFCSHAILSKDIFIVEDAVADDRFKDNVLLVNPPHARFYAGVPLVTPEGIVLGTLCVLDPKKKQLSETQQSVLKSLAKHAMDLFDMRLNNEELQRINKQNTDIQELTRTGAWEWDVETSTTIWSDQVYDIYKVQRGTPVREIDAISYFAPHAQEKLRGLITRTIEETLPFNEELEFIDGNGDIKWTRSIGKPYLNSEGKVYKVAGTFQDITEQKLAQLGLQTNANEIEAYARGLNQYAIVAKTNPKGIITFVNDLFCLISGYSRSELLGQDHRIINSGHHSKLFFNNLWNTIASGQIWNGEIKNKTKDGRFYWVDTTITPSLDSNGNIQEYISFRYDISPRKLYEEKLLESEEKHRILFNQSFDSIMTLSPPEWKFTSGNPAALTFFGFKEIKEMCSHGPWDVSPELQPDGQPSSNKAKSEIEKAMTSGSSLFEWTHMRTDGKLIPSIVMLSRITLGDQTFIQANVRDISEQKRNQQELETSNRFLNLALDGANLGIWDWELGTENIIFNKRWAEMIGLNVDEIAMHYETWKNRVHPEDLAKCQTGIENYLSGKTSVYENVHRMKHAQGHWVHILTRGKFHQWDKAGKPIRFCGTHLDISTQKILEIELIEAQAISKIGSWQLNLMTNEQTWSKEHYKIFEIDEPQQADRLYKLYRSRIAPDDLPLLDWHMERALMKGEDFVYDHRVVLDNGTRIKYVQGIGKVSKDENGKPIRISGTCRDRTASVESEAKFKTLIETMSEGLVVHDSKGQIIQYNSSALKILDLTDDQILGRSSVDPLWKAIKMDGTDFVGSEHPAMLALITGKIVSNVTMGLRFKQNETRWVRINAVPVESIDGRRALVTFSDITELVKANEENRFVLDSIGIGVWKFNPVTQELHWDDSMYKIFEKDPAQFSGHYEAWESSLTTEAKAIAVEALSQALSGKKEFSTTFEIKSKSNKKKYIGGHGKVIRNENGDPLMMYGINWDRTKEFELEEKLQLERAKALHNAKLASIGELAAGVGHEINNPLAIIAGQISISEQYFESIGFTDPQILNRFKRMEVAVSRISNIIKGLRVFSRSDESQRASFDVFDLIKETVDMLKEIYKREEVQLTLNSSENMGCSFGNRGRLQQVLVNLITNAKDASLDKPNRTVEVTASMENGFIKIMVADNGCGIPDEIKEKIFNPFFTTKEINKGTGIGLSLVSTIIKEHEGKIELETETGQGSKFIIYLPVLNGPNTKEIAPEAKAPVKTKQQANILIVDDEEDLREILKFLLSKNFSNIFVADGAQAALDIVSQQKIDLVLSDIKMPGTDGFKFLKLLRENQTIEQPQFIFISGGVEMDAKQQEIIQAQTNGILSKPFNEAQLMETLKFFIKE